MAKSCCDKKSDDLAKLAGRQSNTLKIALMINLAMFFIELYSGIVAGSISLMADSLDMFGDAFVYGFSLFVIGKSTKWNLTASLLKGAVMLIFGAGVMISALVRFYSKMTPSFEIMGFVGVLALFANILCAVLLLRHKSDDMNMRSAWLCSRNDVIANLGVLIAAGAVMITGSRFPDLITGSVISMIVLKSSVEILADTIREFRKASV